MSWKIVAKDIDPKDPGIKKLFTEALQAAPQSYVNTTIHGNISSAESIAMLSRRPLKSFCRLCNSLTDLTKEHIPPKSSGNKERHTHLTFDDWLRDRLDHNPDAKYLIEQGGIFGYTLCKNCNSLTGKFYGGEYKSWVERVKKIINEYGGAGMISELDAMIGPFGKNIIFGSKTIGAVKPGAFVRQIMSCMCSLSGSWNLAERYPVIRRIILEQSAERLPVGMELGMFLYFGPRVRIQGPQFRIDTKNKIWRWVEEIAYPPFAFQLMIESNKKDPGLGLLIDNFTLISPEVEQYYSGVIEMGFGWSPYPGDYRSKATIAAARQIKK